MRKDMEHAWKLGLGLRRRCAGFTIKLEYRAVAILILYIRLVGNSCLGFRVYGVLQNLNAWAPECRTRFEQLEVNAAKLLNSSYRTAPIT